MDTLWLSKKHAESIARHALSDAPHEACGLIIGNRSRVEQVLPIRNIADDPCHRYVMDPTELARHLPEIYAASYEVIGFYHSHPDEDPVFSEIDWRESDWHDHVYLIASLKSRTPRFAAWIIETGRVSQVELHIGDDAPAIDDGKLSNAHKAVIISAGLIVFAVMIVLSLYLLPPAPPIP